MENHLKPNNCKPVFICTGEEDCRLKKETPCKYLENQWGKYCHSAMAQVNAMALGIKEITGEE